MGVSLNGGTPKSSILIGFSIINHPFWGTPIFGNTHVVALIRLQERMASAEESMKEIDEVAAMNSPSLYWSRNDYKPRHTVACIHSSVI